MEIIITIIMFATVTLPVLAFAAFMPWFTRKTDSFGVSVPQELFGDPRLKKMRAGYRNVMLVFGLFLTACAAAIVLANDETAAIIGIGVMTPLLLGGMSWCYFHYHHKMKKLKAAEDWQEGETELQAADTAFRAKRLAVSPFWFSLHFAVIAATLAVSLIAYDRMPDKVPLQYDFSGNVTRYADKTPGVLLFAPLIQFVITALMLFVYWIIRKSKATIDASRPDESALKNRIFRYRWSAFTVFASLALLFIFSWMNLSFLFVMDTLMMVIPPLVITGGMVVGSLVLSVTTGQGGSRVRLAAGDKTRGSAVNRDEDRFWKLGVFYWNPDDPALFVEKRFGIGFTMNFGRKAGWLILAAFLLFIIGIAVVLPLLLL